MARIKATTEFHAIYFDLENAYGSVSHELIEKKQWKTGFYKKHVYEIF